MNGMPFWLDFEDVEAPGVPVSVAMQHIASLRSITLPDGHPSRTLENCLATEVTLSNGRQYLSIKPMDFFKGRERPAVRRR